MSKVFGQLTNRRASGIQSFGVSNNVVGHPWPLHLCQKGHLTVKGSILHQRELRKPAGVLFAAPPAARKA
jgi:hypothetical protein